MISTENNTPEGEWILLNKEEYQDWILLKKSDFQDLIDKGRESLGDRIEILEAIYKWLESANKLKEITDQEL